MVANSPIVLGTKTPLGAAQITLPAGASLESYEILPDGNIKVWQGPFMAVVSPADAAFPTPPPTPTPAPEPSPSTAPAGQESTPAPEPSPSPVADLPAPFALQPLIDSLQEGTFDWKTHAPAAGVGLLGLYALVVTVAWLRQRRRNARAAKTAQAPAPPIPAAKQALPVTTTDGRDAIACPHCGAPVPLGEPRQGRHICPSCRGPFVCE